MMRVLIPTDPFAHRDHDKEWNKRGIWPCRWIQPPTLPKPPFVLAFRKRFTVAEEVTLRIHVTADERYELWCDGVFIGRGSERGDKNNWFFETYDLPLLAGEHSLVARVWAQGTQAPFAQMSVQPGFLLAPDTEEWTDKIGTGVAVWEVKTLTGYTFVGPMTTWGTGDNLDVDGSTFAWNWETGGGEDWQPAVLLEGGSTQARNDRPPTQLLRPAILPPMHEQAWETFAVRHIAALDALETASVPVRAADHLPAEVPGWDALLHKKDRLIIPPHTMRRVLLDLGDYVCAYPEVVTSGGKDSLVRIHWQESLYEDLRKNLKGNRNAIEGKFFGCVWWAQDGVGDTFRPDGGSGRHFDTLWWQCGRYVEIVVQTADEPLTLNALTLHETRYPFEPHSHFETDDPRLTALTPLAVRALQMCAHETYMDCPYFEQLMYIGDTRLQTLCFYLLTRDVRLPKKAMEMFDASRFPYGLTQSRYPTRVDQTIPPFSLWHIGMVYDYALWRDDLPFVKARMPGVRAIVDVYLSHRNSDGLLTALDGWNTLDWVPDWKDGCPPDADRGISGVMHWMLAYTLGLVAALETHVGEPELAARAQRLAKELVQTAEVFWNEERGLYADNLEQTRFSEHAQCFAILSRLLDAERQERIGQSLLTDANLSRTTIYFSHYLFETFRVLNRPDALLARLDLWDELARLGLKTTVEMPEPTRSDCHAWGAHPLYHFYASLLGVRPVGMGFRKVRIAPQFGSLTRMEATVVHPNGDLYLTLHRDGESLTGSVILPPGVTGTFRFGNCEQPLRSGKTDIALG